MFFQAPDIPAEPPPTVQEAPAPPESEEAPSPPPEATAAEETGLVTVMLADGQELVGYTTGVPDLDGTLRVTLLSGHQVLLLRGAVKWVRFEAAEPGDLPEVDEPEPQDSGWPVDPNRTRYFYTPSAFALGRGRGYLSQKELLLTSGAIGVTPYLDVQVGTVLPMLFTGLPVGVVGTKAVARVSDTLGVGVGIQGLVVEDEWLALGFANVTGGTSDAHVTLAVGAVAPPQYMDQAVKVVVVAGNRRLGPKSALVTENWLMMGSCISPGCNDLWLIPSGGVRLFGPAFSVDLALVPFVGDGQVIPIPFVDFTWNFGAE